MSDYTEFFLAGKSSDVQLDLIEISHPNFTKTYRIVRNATEGVTVTLEDSNVETFDYYPLEIRPNETKDDLDFGFQMVLGDLGEILPAEIDNVSNANGFDVKPVVKYRTYSSDNLTAPLFGPLILEIRSFAFNREGSTFEASVPSLNINTTGELYTLERFPMLRGFL